VGWGGLEEFGALFAPGMRHEQEEKQRLELSRDDLESGDPPSTVDLDGNRAIIRLPRKPAPDPDATT
jgi:Family of unknown function (DUF6191)